MTVRSAAQNFYDTPLEAVATGEQVVALAEQWGHPGWLSLAEYGLGQAYHIAGRYREAEQMVGRACAQLMGPEPSTPIGTTAQYLLLVCCMMKSITHATLGELEIAEQFQQRAQQIADESNRPFDRIAAAYSGGNLMLARAKPIEAAMVLDEAFALAEEHGVRLFVPVTGCFRGLAYLEQGRIEVARDILAKARHLAESFGYKAIELRASIYLARALGQGGDVHAAMELVRTARNTARQQGFSGLEAEALLCEAMVTPATSEANKETIMRSLRAAIAIATESGARPLLHKAETMLGRMLAEQEDAEDLQD